MHGQLTRGRDATPDTVRLRTLLADIGRSDGDRSYIAKRILVGVDRDNFTADVLMHLTSLDRGGLDKLVDRLANRATIYDLPRQIILNMSKRGLFGERRRRLLDA